MYNQDVLDLYPRVNVGTKVTVTYQNFAGVASSGPAAAPQQQQQWRRRLILQPVRRRPAAGEAAPQGDPRQERFRQGRAYQERLVAVGLRHRHGSLEKGGPQWPPFLLWEPPPASRDRIDRGSP